MGDRSKERASRAWAIALLACAVAACVGAMDIARDVWGRLNVVASLPIAKVDDSPSRGSWNRYLQSDSTPPDWFDDMSIRQEYYGSLGPFSGGTIATGSAGSIFCPPRGAGERIEVRWSARNGSIRGSAVGDVTNECELLFDGNEQCGRTAEMMRTVTMGDVCGGGQPPTISISAAIGGCWDITATCSFLIGPVDFDLEIYVDTYLFESRTPPLPPAHGTVLEVVQGQQPQWVEIPR